MSCGGRPNHQYLKRVSLPPLVDNSVRYIYIYSTTLPHGRLCLKCDGTHTETIFHLLAKRTRPFKSAGASVHSTTSSRCVRISGSEAGYAVFRGSVKSTGYPLCSSVSPSLPLPRVTMYSHISPGLYMSIITCKQTTVTQSKV